VRRWSAIFLLLLPQRLKHIYARRVLGWDIHPTAYIGRSLIQVRKVTMGPQASIGPMNYFRDVEELRMGEGANIAARNWIIGIPKESVLYPDQPDRDPSLIMGDWSNITVGHEIDVADRLELGNHAVIAGFKSAILTHSLNLVTDKFVTGKVVLGDYGILLSGCTVQNGMRVPAYSIVSAGSVIATKLTKEYTFYRGNPAEAVRELPPTLGVFKRVGRQSQLAEEVERWRGNVAGLQVEA
jgi:acetyltransferase-like isoleucine patch superfamily enzyme